MMGRNMSEGSGSMSGAAEDDGNGGSMSEAAEDDGSGGSVRKCAEAFRRLRKVAVRCTTIAFSAGGRRSCVSALQDTLGISYKDTAHRLFLAEVEQVKKADSAAKSFTAVWHSLESLVTSDILPPIQSIDNIKGELDEYVWKDGKWLKLSKDSEGQT